jgi:hypothetical protein
LICDEVSDVKRLISENRGSTSVIFYDTSKKAYQSYDGAMDLNIDTYNRLIDILGEENVVPK